jgi:hypothetical protein
MRREARCLFVFTIVALLVGCRRDSAPDASRRPAPANGAWPDVEDVVAQLEGHHCRYSVQVLGECAPRPTRGFFDYLFTRHDDRWTCPTGAARCLAKMGPAAAAAVPALIRALEQGPPDYDTGDGVIPVRSSVIEALGRSGDARAVAPLGRAVSEPSYTVAALGALGDLGPLAQGQAAVVASVLEARIADTEGRARTCAEAVRQYDDFLANDAVVERLKAAHPEETRFLVSPAEHDAALRALDRSTDTYIRGREGRCRDLVADRRGAARAVGGVAGSVGARSNEVASRGRGAGAAGGAGIRSARAVCEGRRPAGPRGAGPESEGAMTCERDGSAAAAGPGGEGAGGQRCLRPAIPRQPAFG